MTCQEGKGLNIRPLEPELQEVLRALAQAEGLRLYEYLLAVLKRHVVRAHRGRGVPSKTAGDFDPLTLRRQGRAGLLGNRAR
jgi:hypothetical protein